MMVLTIPLEVTAHEPFTSPRDPKNNVLAACLVGCILDLELMPAGRSWCSLRLADVLTDIFYSPCSYFEDEK